MAARFLIDTDVLIDYLRDQPDAVGFLEGLPGPQLLCAITVAELYAGVREGDERTELDAFIKAFEVVPIDEAVAVKGGTFKRDFSKSHKIGLADALIAAAAESRGVTLVTLNKKHFPMLAAVNVPYKKP